MQVITYCLKQQIKEVALKTLKTYTGIGEKYYVVALNLRSQASK